jgi:hypothetical protein
VLKLFHPKIPHTKSMNLLFSTLISLFGICSFMSLIFCIRIESIKVFLCMINYLSLLVETLAGLVFFNSSALKTSLNLKHILFQNKMDSIPNNLKPDIKEETEEEKIDIENHFHPVISSCEEAQLTRSVC